MDWDIQSTTFRCTGSDGDLRMRVLKAEELTADERRWTPIAAFGFIGVHRRSSAVSILVFVLLASSAVAQDSWPQFRSNHALTGVTTAALPDNLKLLWTYDAGTDPIESSAAIADGVVYVGSASGQLIAVDLATGKERWKYKTAQDVEESSPAVSAASGTVFVGDLSGMFHA